MKIKYCSVNEGVCQRALLTQASPASLLLLPPFLNASGTEPFSFGFRGQVHTGEVKPLDGTVRIVTAYHLPIGHLVAQAVGGLIRVHGHVQHVRGMDRQDGVGELRPAFVLLLLWGVFFRGPAASAPGAFLFLLTSTFF